MTLQTMRRASIGLFFAVSIIFLLALAPATQAQFKSFNWEAWDVDMTLLENGDMEVIETQTLFFSGAPYTYGYRSIPTGSAGRNDGITNISVREGDLMYRESSSNAPGTFEVLNSGDETRINWYFEPALGERTYEFSYTIKGAVQVGTAEEGDGDQIQWRAIPPDHPSYINRSQTTIRLPEGVAPQQYYGTEDYLVAAYIDDVETSDVAITVSDDGRTITYDLLRPLNTNEQMGVRVQFPHGLLPIETPGWQAAQQRSDIINLALLGFSMLLLIGGPLGVLLLWYLKGRDPQLGVVVPEYLSEPPSDLPPAMVGTLVDERADMDDITSTMVDLAHRGYLTMEQQKKGYVFHRTDKPASDLREYEKTYLAKFFRNKEEVTLESMRYKFSENLPTLRNQLYRALVDEGYVPRSPQDVRSGYSMMAGIVLVAGIGLTIAGSIVFGSIGGLGCLPFLAVVATAVTLFIAARHMPVKTEKGALATAQWLAFKEYLKNIKKYGDLEEASARFEEYLPYAVCFGLERSFITTFADVPTTPIPTWYFPYPPVIMSGPATMGGGPTMSSGGGSIPRPSLEGMSGNLTGGLAAMSVGLTQMLNSANTVMQSVRPTASSSGGSGGGFSGGGGGGGGFG